MDRVLILSNVHVEPTSTAAGRRMLQLIESFRSRFEIHYATTASESEFAVDLATQGVTCKSIEINSPAFDAYVRALDPTVVLFDRFMVEEQFGWRVHEQCPQAIRVLDTEDLHCLRYAREAALRAHRHFEEKDLLRDVAYREVASILRSDLSLMISEYEVELLQRVFYVPPSKLCYLPFLEQAPDKASWRNFEERAHFVSIGNFRHAPNRDAVSYLKERIWPKVRAALPKSELHVYGAYASQEELNLSDNSQGFLVKGRAEDALDVLRRARVLLAPLRFGAGLKGKLLEAMLVGTPSVTTSIGAEGMHGNLPWPGFIEDSPDRFAERAVSLYSDESEWTACQSRGLSIVTECFDSTRFVAGWMTQLGQFISDTQRSRSADFMGQMMWHHTLRSTKFMAKWIESKNSQAERTRL